MDPVTTKIALNASGALSEAGKESARGFLNAVLHAPGEALGGLFADQINARRHANLIKIAANANKKLRDAGVSPKEVPLSLIHPALEAASLQEEPTLQEMWANLLANAADPRCNEQISPAFATILKELSPRDAKFLESLYQLVLEKKAEQPSRHLENSVPFGYFDFTRAYANTGMAQQYKARNPPTSDDLARGREVDAENQRAAGLCKEALLRQGIIFEEYTMIVQKGFMEGNVKGVRYKLPRDEYDLRPSHYFTRLGVAFINACHAPAK